MVMIKKCLIFFLFICACENTERTVVVDKFPKNEKLRNASSTLEDHKKNHPDGDYDNEDVKIMNSSNAEYGRHYKHRDEKYNQKADYELSTFGPMIIDKRR
jgi:hypothetical protein